MNIINYFKKNYDSITETVKKYPITLFLSFLGGALISVYFNKIGNLETIKRLVFVSSFGMVLFAKVEGLEFQRKKVMVLSKLVSAILLVSCYFYMPVTGNYKEMVIFIGLALLLVTYLFFIPNNKNINRENSVDHFTKSFNAFFVTSIYSLILYIGFLLLGISIEKLFDVNLVRDWEGRLFFLIVYIYSPLNYLVMIEDKSAKIYSRFIKVFLRFVLLPLLISYGIILYAYLVRLGIIREYPKEVIPFMVLAYSFLGIFFIYITDNLEGGKIYERFKKYFYVSLLPLVPLLYYSIIMRIRQYGITENRYFILISALWLTVIILYMLVSKKKHLLFLPYITMIFIFFSTIGPVNSSRVSFRSQKHRLDAFMESLGNKWTEEEIKQFSRFLDYFADYHTLVESGLTDNKDLDRWELAKEYDVEFIGKYSASRNQRTYLENKKVISVKGYDYYLRMSSYENEIYGIDNFQVHFKNHKEDDSKKDIIIKFGKVEYKYYLQDIYAKVYEDNKNIKGDKNLSFKIDEKEFEVNIVLDSLSHYEDENDFYGGDFNILIKLK